MPIKCIMLTIMVLLAAIVVAADYECAAERDVCELSPLIQSSMNQLALVPFSINQFTLRVIPVPRIALIAALVLSLVDNVVGNNVRTGDIINAGSDALNQFHNTVAPGGCVSDKKQLVAVILSWVVGIVGADRFYIGENVLGVVKLLITLLICPASCIGSACGKGCGIILPMIIMLGASAFWLHDAILFTKNDLPDSNGCALIGW